MPVRGRNHFIITQNDFRQKRRRRGERFYVIIWLMETYETHGAEETFALGKEMAQAARPGEVYLLFGDLGAGKTVWTQGFAEGLQVTEPVTSPTFTILKVYPEGRLPLYHFDAYRIGDLSELDEIGFEECVYGDGVSVIEWPTRITEALPEDAIRVTITAVPERGFDERVISVARHGI